MPMGGAFARLSQRCLCGSPALRRAPARYVKALRSGPSPGKATCRRLLLLLAQTARSDEKALIPCFTLTRA
ncbi:hypothetical protein PsYK624_083730 [Phanerochaete sordida]|uniref:Uncharacterized protein n=1 Tax=Phanerochaete sordida TaxID=48140 RepID=A0A9P3GED1_9APHY|nr:hypothetical protein PsYK624_083730 [Phanerochaete sordida]